MNCEECGEYFINYETHAEPRDDGTGYTDIIACCPECGARLEVWEPPECSECGVFIPSKEYDPCPNCEK